MSKSMEWYRRWLSESTDEELEEEFKLLNNQSREYAEAIHNARRLMEENAHRATELMGERAERTMKKADKDPPF